ncbi:MAG TPA: VOC family protein [Candidatus Methylomirabilis sp.]|nr:VOC family protein [Candidatus Methylomirabilis sp.]
MFCYLGYVVLFVEDLDHALAFYRDKVGLSVRFQDKGYAELAVAGSKFALLARSRLPELVGEAHTGRPAKGAHGAGVTLLVEDVDRIHRDLSGRGVSFLGSPQNRPWGQRTAYFQDPEGHLIEIATNLPRSTRTAG